MLRRALVSRPTELLCDAMGAGWTSRTDLARGLEKLHALHPLREERPLTALAYSLATHPPLAERLQALGRPHPMARRHQALWLCMTAAWLLAAVLGLFLGGWWGAGLLAALAFGPSILLMLAARADTAVARELVPQARWGVRGFFAGLLLLVLALLAELWLLAPLGLLLVVAGGLWGQLRGRAIRKLHGHLRQREFLDAWACQQGFWGRTAAIAHDASLGGLCAAEPAIQQAALDRLAALSQRFPMASLTRAIFLADRDLQAACVEMEALLERFPQHPQVLAMAGRTRLRSGDLDGAEEIASRLDGEPEAPGLRAALALKRGRLDEAERELEAFEESRPGDLDARLMRVELALERGDHDTASQALQAAEAMVAHSPFAFVHGRLARLRAGLEGLDGEE